MPRFVAVEATAPGATTVSETGSALSPLLLVFSPSSKSPTSSLRVLISLMLTGDGPPTFLSPPGRVAFLRPLTLLLARLFVATLLF